MKNKKFALTLYLEENQELMNEIDNLIRERVKFIIREEAEKMLGGSVQEEVSRVVNDKIKKMNKFDIMSTVSSAIARIIRWDGSMKSCADKAMSKWCEEHTYIINQQISENVNRRLNNIVQIDVIEAITNALIKKSA